MFSVRVAVRERAVHSDDCACLLWRFINVCVCVSLSLSLSLHIFFYFIDNILIHPFAYRLTRAPQAGQYTPVAQ